MAWQEPSIPQDFGAVGDGITDDTGAMSDFFNFCIDNEREGYIPAGTYRVAHGALVFDNGYTNKPWPVIRTAGHGSVTLIGIGSTDAPIIEINNGTATDTAGRFWQGGELGGITFQTESNPSGAVNRHGLILRGIYGMKIGYMFGLSLFGSTVAIPNIFYQTTNPDPYAVYYCEFDGIEAKGSAGRALENKMGAGLTFCTFKSLRAVNCTLGCLYGLGAANHFNFLSVGICSGWAIYDGDEGTVDRTFVTDCELDDVQYGIRVNQAQNITFDRVRFIHRYNYSSINPGEGYWPRTAISLGQGTSPIVLRTRINAIHRFESGGSKSDLGTFLDVTGAGGNLVDADVDQLLYNNPLGVADADLVTGVNTNSQLRVLNAGRSIVDSRPKHVSFATGASGFAVGNSSYGGTGSILPFSVERFDAAGDFDPSSGQYGFKVPYAGLVRVKIGLPLNLPVGTKRRLGVLLVQGSSTFLEAHRVTYQTVAANEPMELDQMINVAPGDILYAIGDQGTGAPVAVVPEIAFESEVFFQVEMI